MECGVAFRSGYSTRAGKAMSTEAQRTCPSCGNEFSGAMEFCPVCMLRKGLADGIVSGESVRRTQRHGRSRRLKHRITDRALREFTCERLAQLGVVEIGDTRI